MAAAASGKQTTKRQGQAAATRWFFDNSLDMFAVVNREGLFVDVNEAWERMTGWVRDDLVGKPIFEFLHPDCYEEARDSRRRMKRDGFTVNQLRIRRKDGRWMWIQGRSRLSPNDEMIGTLHDITDQVLQREELEAARKTQSMLSEAAGIGTWSYEPRENRIDWSQDILNLCGWSSGDIDTPDKFYAIVDPEQRTLVDQAFLQGVATGEGATIEHRFLTRDGRWLVMRATFRTEPRGRMYALKGISQDVTALAEARDAAQAGERRVHALMQQAKADAWRQELALNAAEAGAFEIDHLARTFWGSDQFFRVVGRRLTFDEIARPVWAFTHDDDRQTVADASQIIIDGGESFSVEFRILQTDDTERWVRVFFSMDRAAHKSVGLILDIDARKRQELALVEAQQAAQAAADAKASFLTNMSHEIRTPMNGVLGVLHLLRRETVSAEGLSLLDEALSCGEMLQTLLDDVIDFERIEAGRLELNDEPVDAGGLARSVCRLLEPQAEAKGLTLTLEGAEDLGWVRTDPVRLRQCLFNLIGNAVKFTLKGGVTLRCARQSGGLLAFAVEDTGVGIPVEAQQKLFERFHQADGSITRRFGGSGLGLAITRRLAQMMGGSVDFDSTPGVGSTFRLAIRAERAQPVAPVEVMEGAPLEGLSILVVEDNPTNRTIAIKLLQSLGADVETAADGTSGVAAAAMASYDLILMDIQMPGMDGMEACRRIRSLPGPAGEVPIIALTANVLSHQRETYLAAGMQGVVGKPIAPSALLEEISRLAEAAGPESAVA